MIGYEDHEIKFVNVYDLVQNNIVRLIELPIVT